MPKRPLNGLGESYMEQQQEPSAQNLYEGMFVLKASLSDDDRRKTLEKITQLIVDNGGEVLKIHDQGRRKLAYEIEGSREGYYYLIFYKVSPSAIAPMWKEYHLNQNLLRFLTLRAEEVLEKIEFKSLAEQH
jgi:small subunit ribosomal protein S6